MTTKDTAKTSARQCANCFACKKGTEFCPLSEHYDEDALLAKLREKFAPKKITEAQRCLNTL